MPKFLIRGTMRDTGKAVKVEVEADNAEHASARANRHGVAVESVTAVGETTTQLATARPEPFPLAPPPPPVHAAVPVVARPVAAPPPIPAMPPMPAAPPVAAQPSWMNFVGAGQDPALVHKLYNQVLGVMTAQETLQVLVVQKKPLINVSPDALAATDRRVVCYRTKVLGRMTMDDFLWNRLADARLSEGFMGATVSFSVIGGPSVTMEHLPKEQARAFYRFAQQQEEAAIQARRQLSLEEARAAAGGVTVQNLTQPFMNAPMPMMPVATGGEADPMARLQKLKSLLDAGLISQGEFDAKKADILAAM